MKHKLNKILHIECTLDSSEAIMFTKGGKHSLRLEPKRYDPEDGDDDGYIRLNLDSFDIIDISFQIERDHQSRFDSLTTEAMKHRGIWDEINAQSKEEAKKRMEAYAEQMRSLKPKPKNVVEPSAP